MAWVAHDLDIVTADEIKAIFKDHWTNSERVLKSCTARRNPRSVCNYFCINKELGGYVQDQTAI